MFYIDEKLYTVYLNENNNKELIIKKLQLSKIEKVNEYEYICYDENNVKYSAHDLFRDFLDAAKYGKLLLEVTTNGANIKTTGETTYVDLNLKNKTYKLT